jgi:hypothetical protein
MSRSWWAHILIGIRTWRRWNACLLKYLGMRPVRCCMVSDHSHQRWGPARNPAHGVEACRRLTRVDPVRKRITILELKTKDIARERLATKSRLHIDFLRFPSTQIDLLCWNFLILSNENKWEKITSNYRNIHINSGKRKLIAFETILFDKFTKLFYLI